MIFSMTGFGRATVQMNDQVYAIELKSLNSKQLDLNLRIPSILKTIEMDVRSEIGKVLKRGKIELIVSAEKGSEISSTKLNQEQIALYVSQFEELNKNYNIDNSNSLSALLSLPNVMVTEENKLDEGNIATFNSALKEAFERLNNFRLQEGEAMQTDFLLRINKIKDNAESIEKIAPTRVDKIRARIKQNLDQLALNGKVDQDRFEQEMIYYLEKFDITEELVRLENHCKYFIENIHSKETSKGKKLNFISQELGREINTIGSKANDIDLQKLVVEMKDELEKIKEQLNNVL